MKLMDQSQFKRWLSYLLLIVAGIVVYAIVNNLAAVSAWFHTGWRYLSPFVAAAVIAYLLDIPCGWIERQLRRLAGVPFLRKHARGVSVLITYAVTVAIIVFIMRLLIPEIARSVMEFVVNIEANFGQLVAFVTEITDNERIVEILHILGIEAYIADLSFKSVFDAIGYDSLWNSMSAVLSVPLYLLYTLIAIAASVYLLLDVKRIGAFFANLIHVFIPQRNAEVLIRYLGEINRYFKKFLAWNTIDGVIIGVVSVIGLLIIGVRYPIVLGIVSGVLNMIPYFGAIAGVVLIVLITLLTDSIGKTVATFVFLLILQQLDGSVIKVKLYGGSFKITPFLVLFSITIGGFLYGIVGMIVAIPAVAVLKLMVEDAIAYKLKKNAAES